jgi:hypothetical protein
MPDSGVNDEIPYTNMSEAAVMKDGVYIIRKCSYATPKLLSTREGICELGGGLNSWFSTRTEYERKLLSS